MSAPTGFTTVSASRLQDATGTAITNATIYFRPVDNKGNPISFLAGGAGGQVSSKSVQTSVLAGSFSVLLADTTLSTPVNVGYSVVCIDNLTGDELLGPGYSCVQPFGVSWNFDSYIPPLYPGTLVLLAASPIPGITFVDTVDGQHINVSFANGVMSIITGGVDFGAPVRYVAFIDSVTGQILNISFADGVQLVS